MAPLGIGIVGLGGQALRRLPSILRDEWVRIAAVLSRESSAEKTRQVPAGYGVETEVESDVNRFFARKDVQAVFISVPSMLHYNLARESLLAGKHTSVEYPMT